MWLDFCEAAPLLGEIRRSELKINDEIIHTQKEVTLVGVTLDNKLSLAPHISTICKRAANQLNSIKRLNKHFDAETKKHFVRTYVLSHFNYCNGTCMALLWKWKHSQNGEDPRKSIKICIQRLYIRIQRYAPKKWGINIVPQKGTHNGSGGLQSY